MKSFNWGIIGPGNIAHDFARDLSLMKHPQKLIAVLGRTMDSAETFAKEFNIDGVYCELDEFVQHKGLDVVYIATPHPQHFEQAMACLEKRIGVLCEKPMTLNAYQAMKLVQASEENESFLMEAMWIRFLPSMQKVLSLISEDAIGKIISIKASMGYKAPKDKDSRYFNPELGGGSLLDLGVYTVFLAQLLLGKPATVKSVAALTDTGVDASCATIMGYNNGAYALLDSSLESQSDRPAEIAGEKGIIRILNPWFEKSTGIEFQLYNKEKETYPLEWEGHGLQYEIDEVVRCLTNKQIESDLFSHEFTRQISETMDEIRSQVHVTYTAYE